MGKELKDMTNEELWQLFPIILCEHNPLWIDRYRITKVEITKIIASKNIERISHIGSTAVKGLIAKPTIDILLEIKKDSNINKIIRSMEAKGYIYVPQESNPQPHFTFYKGYTPKGFKGQAYHIHVRFSGDHDELYFRDYLNKNPKALNEYAKLKEKLKEKYEHNRDLYTEEKTDFIKQATIKARQEFKDRYKP